MNKGTMWIVVAALISLVIAVYVWFTGNKDAGLFIGLWVPSLLALATYLKK
jgi:uncharacterized membrane protein HdeD (DUF308 family)